MVVAIGASRLQIRRGLSSDTPALVVAELGWDSDSKTLRTGDDTNTPPKILTTKSTGDFDFSSSTSVKFSRVEIKDDETVDGVDISKLNAETGILARVGDNAFEHLHFASTDGSLDIVNPDGTSGSQINITLSAGLMAVIGGLTGGLTSVSHDDTMEGSGTPLSPLSIPTASTQILGSTRHATVEEAEEALSAAVSLTPRVLRLVGAQSTLAQSLRALIGALYSVAHNESFEGEGTQTSPLALAMANEKIPGGVVLATLEDLNNGVGNGAVTPETLKALASGSVVAAALADAMGLLSQVSTSESFDGSGTANAPLALREASISLLGGILLATEAEVELGASANKAITPAALAAIDFASNMAGAIRAAIYPLTGNGLLFKTSAGAISWAPSPPIGENYIGPSVIVTPTPTDTFNINLSLTTSNMALMLIDIVDGRISGVAQSTTISVQGVQISNIEHLPAETKQFLIEIRRDANVWARVLDKNYWINCGPFAGPTITITKSGSVSSTVTQYELKDILSIS